MDMPVRKEILIVEDNEINRMTLSGILSTEYRVLEAENGQDALRVLEEHTQEVSLILLDIVMPIMDGYAFLSAVKADPVLSSIPVIVTTQSDSEADEVAALSHGATDFVAKPYKPQVILHRVASIIHLRESAAMVNQFQYDQLTGLYSKAYFYQRVREIITQHPEQQFDLVCSDIENFKVVNDVFGTTAGDRLLCDMAEIYQRRVKEFGICGRINADQFASLIIHRVDYTDDVFLDISGEVNLLSHVSSVMIKWGIYTIDDREPSVEQMCDRALMAARSIKGQYGKFFAVYDDTLRSKLLREQAIIDNMDAALADGQFQLYLQPKYQIRDDRLAGAEALVRWFHPVWGLQSPGEFIPLFEKNGFITKLDRFVWDQACLILSEWDKKGYPSYPISVNVSRADIYHTDIAEVLLDTVQKYGLPPSRLHLEITESAYTEDPDQIIATVGRLRELGFIIEMDDFGSGYSSLNMLNKMPLDVLKLDMKFIQSETAKPVSEGILRFIMDLARWMDLSVVAEGVETREQLDRLLEIGCDYVQGYLFAKPMPVVEFEALMQEQEEDLRRRQSQWGKRQTLLIADENPEYRDEARKTFQERFQLLEAGDGKSVLACVAEHRDRLSAILLSASLGKGQDGYEVLNQLKRDRKYWNIPVIVTGPSDVEMEERALELGAEEYARKPISQKSLWKRTLRIIGTTAFREREYILRDAAYRDFQTGLFNRRGLDAAVGVLTEADDPVALFLFDLDNLKQINDSFGHVEGDKLIKRFAVLLQSHTRDSDILARFGGDEFIVVMKQMPSGEAAFKKGGEICNAFRKNKFMGERVPSCTAGVVVCQAGESVTEMISRADQALYRAKANGKGSCCLWRG